MGGIKVQIAALSSFFAFKTVVLPPVDCRMQSLF
jgi:hypothetical protein